jgi:antitoxin component YwqK of YwqJK toxin-antitoxin module
MKKIIFVMLFFFSCAVYGQKMPDSGVNKIRINESDKTVVAGVVRFDGGPRLKPDLFYYWYSANAIHSTQGGFSGLLLNGPYSEYYLNKNLKAQGAFKKGLKSGIWKSWNEDGTANSVSTWEKGRLVPGGSVSFWEKLNVFNWKTRRHHADTLKTPNK